MYTFYLRKVAMFFCYYESIGNNNFPCYYKGKVAYIQPLKPYLDESLGGTVRTWNHLMTLSLLLKVTTCNMSLTVTKLKGTDEYYITDNWTMFSLI